MSERDKDALDNDEKGLDGKALSFLTALESFMTLDSFMREVSFCVTECSVEGYLVGGLLRDIALGQAVSKDYDFVVSGRARDIAEMTAQRLGGSCFLLDRSAGAYRVVVKREAGPVTIDISPLRGMTIEDDLRERDFTVNAMAVSLSTIREKRFEIIDPFGGLPDAGARILKAVTDDAFAKDPLRCVRAVRLAHSSGLLMDEKTSVLAGSASGLLRSVAAERVRDELTRIFSSPSSSGAISKLYGLGIMDVIAPELAGWQSISGYGLLSHSLGTIDEADRLIRSVTGTAEVEACLSAHQDDLGTLLAGRIGPVRMDAFLRLCAFVHDIGKPRTLSRESGRLRFIGHDSVGSPLAKEMLQRLRFSKAFSTAVSVAVKGHHRVFMLASLEKVTTRARAHFFRATGGQTGVILLLLSLADARATSGARDIGLESLISEMLAFYFKVYIKKRPQPVLSGDDLMRIFSLKEGRIIGELKAAIEKGIEEGEVLTRAEAVSLCRRRLDCKS